MSLPRLPIGSYLRIDKPELQSLIDALQGAGYRVIGPQVAQSAIVYDDLQSISQLAIGVVDQQDGGHYRISRTDSERYFDHVVGPHSLKNYLFPPRETLIEGERADGEWQFREAQLPDEPLAVIGPRACDLRALAIQDRVFMSPPYVDPAYRARRESLFIVGVNCSRAVSTCFCHAMDAGPAVTSGFDLALTELDDCFAVEIGTAKGSSIIIQSRWSPCSMDEIQRSRMVSERLEWELRERSTGRQLDTHQIRDLLMENLEHPRWNEVAERCLSCGNCTMVCPTCFCSSVEEVTDLSGDHVRRERGWASCFTAEHSYLHSGVVRSTTRSRYRQWLTHKLATWQDQFDSSGCTGCGRCITWCPVGIDLTEEVAAIRESPA
jgi:sulfhydrogenase subunit beta (sulfur reductase)